WGVLGIRPEESRSVVFEYRASDLRTMSLMLRVCGLTWTGMMWSQFGPPRAQRMVETLVSLGWGLGLLGGIVMVGFMLTGPVFMLPAVVAFREAHHRRHQRIHADVERLIFEEGNSWI